MKGIRLRGSYTVEAAIYIPMILFLLFQPVLLAIDIWKENEEREISMKIQELDIVSEFYGYQILGEVGKEMTDEK